MSKQYISKKTRLFVEQRAGGLCEYCWSRADCACESFEVEHIIPLSLGGSNKLDNLAFTCRGCNSRKSDRVEALDPLSKSLLPIFLPRLHAWSNHFSWDDSYLVVIGITPIGRATVEALKLNRVGVTNLRLLMKLAGIHPPGQRRQ